MGIDRAAGEEQDGVEHAENGARHQGVADAHHQEKHHADQGQRGQYHEQHHARQAQQVERVGNAGDERAEGDQDEAGDDRLDRAGEVEAQDQLDIC